jgi:hypothetical protein
MATKMARMSPQTESRIVSAVEQVVDMIDQGDPPDDAIVKVAADMQLPVGHVGLLVNAYNTGRTNRQREGRESLVEKAADFPLADPAVILDRLFPKVVKSAAQVERESTVHPDYSLPPTWLTRARDAAEFEKQAAIAPRISGPAPKPYPSDPMERMKRAYHAAERRRRETEEARRVFSAAQDGLVSCFQKLAAWFLRPGNLSIADVRPNVEARWGVDGAVILNHLGRTRPPLIKHAAGDLPPPMDRRAEPYRTIEEAIGQTTKVRDAQAAYERAAAEDAAKSAEELAPFGPARRESLLGLPSANSSAEKQAGPYTTALGVQLTRDMLGKLNEGMQGSDKESLIGKQLRQISSPEHEQALRGIHSEAMLHNMLSHDPIISSYHPYQVADAFNQVSQLAPHVATQPAVMGPLLRRWLQGDVDVHEGDQLIGMETKLKDIHKPPAPPIPVTPAPPRKDKGHGK